MSSIRRRTAMLGALATPFVTRRVGRRLSDAADQLVVPYAPGGGADAVARIIAKLAGDSMGQSIVVENKGGAGSIVGTDLVAKSGARRLHAAARPVRPDLDQPGRLQEPALRSGEGAVARHHDQLLSLCAGDQQQDAGEDAQGIRRARQGEARRLQLRHDRRRRRQPPDERAVLRQGRREDDPHPLSRHGARGRRLRRRTGHHGVRRSGQRAAAHQCRHLAGARRDQPAALAGRAGRADHGRERLSRRRGGGLARHLRAGARRRRRSSTSSMPRSSRR